MDKKLEMMFDIKRWEEKIEHGFDKNIDEQLLRTMCKPLVRQNLYERLLQNSIQIMPPHIILIPKDNGEYRKVFANEDEDRNLLSIINDVYYELYKDKIHPKCVSYQKGIGVQKIILNITEELKKTKNKTGLLGYKVDLSKYFDSVNKETLFKALKEMDSGSVLDKLLYKYYSTDLVFNEDGELVEHYKSLAQGCAFGAFLANYVLRDIDAVISSLNIIYYRYSDDIILIGEESDIALELLKAMLEDKGLSLNPKKVQPLYKNEKFVFLGYELTTDGEHINLSPDKIKKFKREIKLSTKFRKGMKKYDKNNLQKIIKKVLNKTYAGIELKGKIYGWMDRCNIVTEEETIRLLDNYVKDSLKHTWTSSYNHTHNQHHCSANILKECGYTSMVMMWKALKTSYDAYAQLREGLKLI